MTDDVLDHEWLTIREVARFWRVSDWTAADKISEAMG